MRLVDIEAENVDFVELAQKLARENAFMRNNASNWILTNSGLTCCYSGKRLFLADEHYKVLLAFESNSNIDACGVSGAGNYIVCQMCFNPQNDKDSGATALIDVPGRQIIKQAKIEVGGLDTREIFVDEQKRAIFIYVADKVLGDDNNFRVEYDFELLPDEKSLRGYYRKPDLSPYVLNERAKKLISRLQTEGIIAEDEQEILELLDRMKGSDISAHQLAPTYKLMGDLYLERNADDKALRMYETGLSINPGLAVKKVIKMLQKRLS